MHGARRRRNAADAAAGSGAAALPDRAERQPARAHSYRARNVAEHDFSLTPAAYRALSQDIDTVYHSASAVNFIQPYSYMKRDNVQGLREIIRFAAHTRTKPLMLLSTISVYSWGICIPASG